MSAGVTAQRVSTWSVSGCRWRMRVFSTFSCHLANSTDDTWVPVCTLAGKGLLQVFRRVFDGAKEADQVQV